MSDQLQYGSSAPTSERSPIKSQRKSRKPQRLTLKERCLNSCKCFKKKEDQVTDPKAHPLRQVLIDTSKLPHTPSENLHFISNRISTTKYSYLSFVPKSLLVQFKRVSNIYFLITMVLCLIPNFSPLPAYTAIIPLAFVLLMSMLREAYEDYKRRKNDQITNNKKCAVLCNQAEHHNSSMIKRGTGANKVQRESVQIQTQVLSQIPSQGDDVCPHKEHFQDKLWCDLKCGDIILIEDGQYFPADCVLLLSSASNGECFVQTSSLDGERALKHKQCLIPITTALENRGIMNFNCNIHCEVPTKNLYEFNAFMESEQLPEKGTITLSQGSKKRTLTLDNKQLALRGSNLANTSWAIGVIVYTGKETKLMLNQGQSRFKQSKIEKVVNMICIYLIVIQTVLCIIMSIYSGIYTENYAEENKGMSKANYIFYSELSQTGSSSSDNNPTIAGVKTYGQYYILLNTLIPISLVVSLEFVKLIQTPFINHDLDMYDEESMKQAQPNTMTLHEELASIKYIFADKTGTLTANVMQFKACTIGSVCYDEDYNEDDYEYTVDPFSQTQSLRNSVVYENQGDSHQEKEYQEKENESKIYIPQIKIIDTEFEKGDGAEKAQEYENFKQFKGFPFNRGEGTPIQTNNNQGAAEIVWSFKQSTEIIKNLLETKKNFFNEEINLGKSSIHKNPLILQKQNEYLHYFWLTVVLCHDVITTRKHDSQDLVYQGTSPDEITLLDAAKEVGYIFKDRNSESMKVEIFGKEKTFKLLQKVEFTSERKKMTIIVQDEETGFILLLCKGADLAIFDKLSVRIEQPFLEATKEDLIKFSTKGFRTLCFAVRVLEETFYEEWAHAFESSKLEQIKFGALGSKLKGREQNHSNNHQQRLLDEIESELFLLGATALEDKLQEGVPQVIEDFHNAGIRVWMLTGDKLETAENIGFSSKMFNEKMYIFKLQTKSKSDTRTRLNQIDQKITEIEKVHQTPIIGTQFLLNPNPGKDTNQLLSVKEMLQQSHHDQAEARNIIRALEDFKHESKASEYTLNDSWARRPALRRKLRKRLEEIVPDKKAIVQKLIRENQLLYRVENDPSKYIPSSFDMDSRQYIIRSSNIYRSVASSTTASIKRSNLSNHFSINSSQEVIDNEDTFGILIEGQTLQYMIDSKSMRKKFLKILSKCQAVIVCRASPSQKGLVVSMIKHNEPEIVTLAIGDGANDVNMIQRAHIGIGIFGKEGYQAAGNSDYAIGQFRFLRRLLFVHGRWSGIRLSTFMLFFFQKNIVITLPQFWFGWYCGFSGQTFYDDMYITCYNTFVTAIAICTTAVWDQDLNPDHPDYKELVDLFFPFLYSETQEHDLFTKKKFFAWAVISIAQSIIMFAIPVVTYSYLILENGQEQDMWAMSSCAYFGVVLLHYALIIGFTHNWTLWLLFMYGMSFLFFLPFTLCTYDSFPNTFMTGRLGEIAFSNVYFWLMLLCMIACSLAPVLFYYKAQSLLFPKLKDLILQNELNKAQLLRDLNPELAKQAHELFKQKQQAQLQKWNEDYNNFNPNGISKSSDALLGKDLKIQGIPSNEQSAVQKLIFSIQYDKGHNPSQSRILQENYGNGIGGSIGYGESTPKDSLFISNTYDQQADLSGADMEEHKKGDSFLIQQNFSSAPPKNKINSGGKIETVNMRSRVSGNKQVTPQRNSNLRKGRSSSKLLPKSQEKEFVSQTDKPGGQDNNNSNSKSRFQISQNHRSPDVRREKNEFVDEHPLRDQIDQARANYDQYLHSKVSQSFSIEPQIHFQRERNSLIHIESSDQKLHHPNTGRFEQTRLSRIELSKLKIDMEWDHPQQHIETHQEHQGIDYGNQQDQNQDKNSEDLDAISIYSRESKKKNARLSQQMKNMESNIYLDRRFDTIQAMPMSSGRTNPSKQMN